MRLRSGLPWRGGPPVRWVRLDLADATAEPLSSQLAAVSAPASLPELGQHAAFVAIGTDSCRPACVDQFRHSPPSGPSFHGVPRCESRPRASAVPRLEFPSTRTALGFRVPRAAGVTTCPPHSQSIARYSRQVHSFAIVPQV